MRLLLGVSLAVNGFQAMAQLTMYNFRVSSLLCKSFLTQGSKIVTGGMSGWRGDKFLRRESAGERFFNIFQDLDTFTLIARGSFVPIYKGRTWGGMVLCQYEKIFPDFSSKNYERSYGVLR